MNKERIESAINNLAVVCEKLQADLKTHQQLQSDLQTLRDLKELYVKNMLDVDKKSKPEVE